MVGEDTEGETCCLLSFAHLYEFSSYSYSVDFWDKHHLAKIGLEPFAVYEIVDSAMPFDGRRHYAIMFHDSMFECIAGNVVHSVCTSSVSALIRTAGTG